MKLLNFMSPTRKSLTKIGHNFSNKVVQKLKFSNKINKSCSPSPIFFNEKKVRNFAYIPIFILSLLDENAYSLLIFFDKSVLYVVDNF